MTYLLDDINRQAKEDPKGFIEKSEAEYHARIESAAQSLLAVRRQKPIILVNGPSSSGKTTTAGLLGQAFSAHGVRAEVISMDDYYRTRGSYDMPQTEDGQDDLESPECMDLALLGRHLQMLAAGEEIQVPRFHFPTQRRTEETEAIRLDADKVAIIEGIHSFNDILTGALSGRASCVYLSVDSEVTLPSGETLLREMLRFMRRAVRDRNFRGEPVDKTVRQWRSVRRGEKLYIAPYLRRADFTIDTYLPYESNILMNQMQAEIAQDEEAMRQAGLALVYESLSAFSTIEYTAFLPKESVLREFIG